MRPTQHANNNKIKARVGPTVTQPQHNKLNNVWPTRRTLNIIICR
jgi:hypothetical protein